MKKRLKKIIPSIIIVAVNTVIVAVLSRLELFHFYSYITGLIVGCLEMAILIFLDDGVTIK